MSERSSPQIVIGKLGDRLPFRIDARVLEEDTYLILSADPRPREVTRNPGALLREARKALPKLPGSVVARTGPDGTELLAIVHDLELEPSTTEEWITVAIRNVFDEAMQRGFTALVLPALGSHHGALPANRFAGVLREVLESTDTIVQRIWIELPGNIEATELAALDAWTRT